MSGVTLGRIKTCLCCPELNMKTCKSGLEGCTSCNAITSSLKCSATSVCKLLLRRSAVIFQEIFYEVEIDHYFYFFFFFS